MLLPCLSPPTCSTIFPIHIRPTCPGAMLLTAAFLHQLPSKKMLHRHGNLMRQFLNSGSLSLDNVELETLISYDRQYSEFNMKVSMSLLRMIWVLCRSGGNRRKGREMSSSSLRVCLVSGDNQWELGGNQGAQATMVCEAQCRIGLYKLLYHEATPLLKCAIWPYSTGVPSWLTLGMVRYFTQFFSCHTWHPWTSMALICPMMQLGKCALGWNRQHADWRSCCKSVCCLHSGAALKLFLKSRLRLNFESFAFHEHILYKMSFITMISFSPC